MTDAPPPIAPSLEPSQRSGVDASRGLVLGVLLGGVAYVVVADLLPRTFWWDGSLDLNNVGLCVASLVGLVASQRGGPMPVRFDVREGKAFTAPASRQFSYFVASMALLCAGTTSMEIRIGGRPSGFTSALGAAGLGLWVLCDLMWVLLAAQALRGRPSVDLTARGLVYRLWLGTVVIPWSALTSEVTTGNTWTSEWLAPTVARPDLVRRSGIARTTSKVWLRWQRVDSSFLVAAIRFYVENPGRQAQIGTRGEYARLLVDLGG
jgi:hypothetical protein